MAKKVKVIVKLQIQAGKASPAPPVGTSLGPHGINLMQFCKEYNAKTAGQVGPDHPGGSDRISGQQLQLHSEDPADRRTCSRKRPV